ncbi:hypothetical protein AMTRI_Chr08g207010 [Amborella trichopoda]
MNTFVDFTVSGLFLSPQKAQQQQRSTYPSQLLLLAAKQALKMTKIFDENDHWIASNSTVVKLGDILDKGGKDFKLLYFLEKLKWLDEFKNWGDWFSIEIQMKSLCKGMEKQINILIEARIAALSLGGPISMHFLADNATVLMVGGSIFVHGGILP